VGKKQRILVVDDDQGTANLVRLYLERAGYAVEVSYDGLDALAKAKKQTPDLIVLDIMLPDVSGLDICKQLRSESDVPIIMLTAKVLESDRIQGFAGGADDYVTKPFSPRELVARIQAVIRRCKYDQLHSGPTQITRGKLTMDFERREVQLGGTPLKLTPTEFRLLSVMMIEPNRVFSRGALIERAFGFDYEGFDRTLDVHILHLRRKIKKVDPAGDQYISTMYGMGYTFKADK
jgi:DNA-binding response OmpR family regulator